MPLMVTVQESAGTVAGTGFLDIVVPYTTSQLTRVALKRAEELSRELPSRIRILRMLAVPFPLDLSYPPFSLDILREQTRQVARGIPAEMVLFLTRDPEGSLLKTLRPDSVVVIASKKRWWPTAQERLQRSCERHGHQVALIYSR